MHVPRSEYTRTRRNCVVRDRIPNQENKGSKNRAHSIAAGAGAALQDGERIQEPGARTCNICERNLHHRSPHEVPGAHVSELVRQEVPQVCPEISRIRATKRRSLETEQIALNAAPTTLRQSINLSSFRRRHGDGDLAFRPRTQTMEGNGIPVRSVAIREPAREGTEERESHSRARVQEWPRRGAHGEGAPERVAVCGGGQGHADAPSPRRCPQGVRS
jgi:hypothetical protein